MKTKTFTMVNSNNNLLKTKVKARQNQSGQWFITSREFLRAFMECDGSLQAHLKLETNPIATELLVGKNGDLIIE